MKTVEILLVEDNEGDILLTREALEDSKVINHVNVVKNGKEALEYIFQEGALSDARTPDIILLDINLPLKNGHEVLQVVKSDDRVSHIPVVMLTTSSAEKDVSLSYQHHANAYVSKPIEMEEFFKVVTSIESFWLKVVKLPKGKIE